MIVVRLRLRPTTVGTILDLVDDRVSAPVFVQVIEDGRGRVQRLLVQDSRLAEVVYRVVIVDALIRNGRECGLVSSGGVALRKARTAAERRWGRSWAAGPY